MSNIVRTEKRKRGFFGVIFSLMFWLFNGLMLIWVIAGVKGTVAVTTTLQTDAEQAGAAIGTAIGFGVVLFIWAAGAIVLGLLSFMSRGSKVVIETVVP